jgi:hypothetical protein
MAHESNTLATSVMTPTFTGRFMAILLSYRQAKTPINYRVPQHLLYLTIEFRAQFHEKTEFLQTETHETASRD